MVGMGGVRWRGWEGSGGGEGRGQVEGRGGVRWRGGEGSGGGEGRGQVEGRGGALPAPLSLALSFEGHAPVAQDQLLNANQQGTTS